MHDWKPRLRPGVRLETLPLTAEEGFVLSRLDGLTSIGQLTHLCALPEGRVREIVDRLIILDILEGDPQQQAVPGLGLARTSPAISAQGAAPLPVVPAETLARSPNGGAPHIIDDFDEPTEDGLPPDIVARAEALAALAEMSDDGELPVDNAEAPATGPADDENDPAVDADPAFRDISAEGDEEDAHTGRKLYELELRKLSEGERVQLARVTDERHLTALCFDPVPHVIQAVFDNAAAGFSQARLVARHHRTPQGLDALLARAELARDAQVQGLLLANPMLQEPQLKRILQPKPLAQIYKWSLSRDLPERNRQKVRALLRGKWTTVQAEERAELVFTTEGRVLLQLIGVPFDSHTTSILCGRNYHSPLLIQNLARFSATPPQLLSHLLKQAVVKRQAHLRTMLIQHPNCPSDAKRKAT